MSFQGRNLSPAMWFPNVCASVSLCKVVNVCMSGSHPQRFLHQCFPQVVQSDFDAGIPGPHLVNPFVIMNWTKEPWIGCNQSELFGLVLPLTCSRTWAICCMFMSFQINQKVGSWFIPSFPIDLSMNRYLKSTTLTITNPLFQCAYLRGRTKLRSSRIPPCAWTLMRAVYNNILCGQVWL